MKKSHRKKSSRQARNHWEPHWLRILFAAIAVTVASGLIAAVPTKNSYALEFLDKLAAFSTLFVAIFIWMAEWREKWPKRLTVRFQFPDDPARSAIVCHMAYLAGTGDIRAWGMQIGTQMSGASRLEFDPGIEQSAGRKGKLPDGSNCLHYEVTFILTKLPEPGKETDAEKLERMRRIAEGQTVIWDYRSGSREETWIAPGQPIPTELRP